MNHREEADKILSWLKARDREFAADESLCAYGQMIATRALAHATLAADHFGQLAFSQTPPMVVAPTAQGSDVYESKIVFQGEAVNRDRYTTKDAEELRDLLA